MSSRDPSSWVVHKFGGSSVADADCFARVAAIIESQPTQRVAVVLSACRGVTDSLLQLVLLAEKQDESWRSQLAAVRKRHADIAAALLPAAAAAEFLAEFDRDAADLEGVLRSTQVMRTAGQHVRDKVSGYGEIWSTRLFWRYLQQRGNRKGLQWIDARGCVVAEWGPLGPSIQWEISTERLRAQLQSGAATLVITGYIASDSAGIQTTLGRNGSDFSASIFGALLAASAIVIWTDVDGVLSADPRRVPDAQIIASLSYNEAMELAYFGAKVIHPQTMAPAVSHDIPIWIRNTFAPEKPGTLICAHPQSTQPVKGITSIENVALVNLEGAGMIGVPGTAHRLFGALREENISVILISQGSSEHSICCAIPAAQATRATTVIERAFARELADGQIQSVDVTGDLAILAVVGDGMAGMPGVSGKVFNALGTANVNVRAIAQGASERNISVVVEGSQATRALRSAHAGFYLSPHTLSIGVIGPGTVGKVLLDQLASQHERLKRQFHIDLRVRGIMSSKTMKLAAQSIALERWREQITEGAVPADYDKFYAHLKVDHLPHTVIIDCTASQDVANRYRDWLAAGVHVITPNKKANSGVLDYYESLRTARRQSGAHYLYEATVGAGLPVIQTVRDLRETGDDIASIEGIFSGTLAYLFNVYDGTTAFSAIVRDAKQRGYTEPDPRDDLSGTDVVRKLIILAREMGLKLEMRDVRVESLVPPDLAGGSSEEFLAQLPRHDEQMAKRFSAAKARGHVLRYVGRVTAAGEATVGLVELDAKHAFANIALTDNVVRYSTSRYCDNPLIVQGPGAGPAVTAGGVFADLLRLATFLGGAAVNASKAPRDVACAFAPASVGNVAIGFDILGFSVGSIGDRATVRRTREPGVRIAAVRGIAGDLPLEPAKNTAGRALQAMCDALALPFGMELELDKGIPLSSGLGGSAASAVAAVVAANALLPEACTQLQLLKFAMQGEQVASGSLHVDNIAPSLFGGLVLTVGIDHPRVKQIPVPKSVRAVVVHPHMFLSTREARAILRGSVPMKDFVWQTANLAGFISGCYTNDLDMLRESFEDVVIEPQRAALIPGFTAVRRAAMSAGALGCSISGAGPTVFAWCVESHVLAVREALVVEFSRNDLKSDHWTTALEPIGARVVD